MMTMYTRSLVVPERSFFLFGPRGTGKTTWLRQRLPHARWYDLVRDRELLRLMRQPETFTLEVEAAPADTWIVIDEVQRLPALLNDVQDLMARHPRRFRFALTGSSARRLRREQANLLAARVINRRFFPLTSNELGSDFDVGDAIRYGTLPAVAAADVPTDRVDLLDAYVENYITQEVRIEAGIKRLDAFARFLEVASLANGQVTNMAGIARDAAIARPTVQGYFETLVDTLIGSFLPAWRARAKIKEMAHPKFYFFDPGVTRAVAGRIRDPVEESEKGPLLETYVLHELRARIDSVGAGGKLAYWRTPSGSEVDFVWTRGRSAVGIEVKASERWRTEWGSALRDLIAGGALTRAYGIYLGDRRLKDGPIDVLPARAFFDRLWHGDVLG